MVKILTSKKSAIKVSISFVVLIVIMSLCVSVGTQEISLKKAFSGPGDAPGDNINYEIFIIRLRRVILAALVGAASKLLPMKPETVEKAVQETFSRKGERAVRVNLEALRAGRREAE